VRALAGLLFGTVLAASAAVPPDEPVRPGTAVTLPGDAGSHPEYRTEWWYVTGWLDGAGRESLGFQLTFFRTRGPADAENPSAFAARQLLIVHAALSDPRVGHLLRDERIARAGFGLAEARREELDVHVGAFRLARTAEGLSLAIPAREFSLALQLRERQLPLRHGEAGFSQKGPSRERASFYYSLPQLVGTGRLERAGRAPVAVTASAWLDHEWTSASLEPEARGWDWVGLNLDDGGALMAFRMRDRESGTRYAGGTLRRADGTVQVFPPGAVSFRPLRVFHSPRTAISFPVEWALQLGDFSCELAPLFDDQESDARASTGAVYYEGAVTAAMQGRRIGRGYLELTGYGDPLRLP